MDVQKMIRTGIIGKKKPRSLTIDFSVNGNVLQGAGSAAIVGGKLVITPTVGSELFTDAGFETWTDSSHLTNWAISVAGSSTITQDTTNQRAGSSCAKLTIDGSASNAVMTQAITVTANTWVVYSIYAKKISGTASGIVFCGAGGADISPAISWTPESSYGQIIIAERIPANNPTRGIKRTAGLASVVTALDDISAKAVVTSTTVRGKYFSTQYGIVSAGWNIVKGTPAGVVMCMDSLANPQNMVACIHNGTNLILSKRVNGTVTELINTAATYVAGALVEIRRAAGTNTYQAFYNGSQVGTDQTISDASIINNKYHGIMSTHSQNQCLNFSFVGA